MFDLEEYKRVAATTSTVTINGVAPTRGLSLSRRVSSRRRSPIRRCVACGVPVTNRNLGGNDGRSALSGPLWCLECADCPQQLLLALATSKLSNHSSNYIGDKK